MEDIVILPWQILHKHFQIYLEQFKLIKEYAGLNMETDIIYTNIKYSLW